MAQKFIPMLTYQKVNRAWFDPVVRAVIEQALRCGQNAPRRNQRAGAKSSRTPADDVDAAERGPGPLIGADLHPPIFLAQNTQGICKRRQLLSEGDIGRERREQYDVAKTNPCCQRPPVHMNIFHLHAPT